MSIGANIKRRRLELSISQQDLADLMGYKTRSTIAKIESGQNDVSQKKLKRLATALDTTVENLISNQSKKYPSSVNDSSEIIDGLHKKNRTVAVILAGGKSVRNHQSIPNQFIDILGKPVIVYCLEAYQKHPAIDDIYVVCLKGWGNIVTAYANQYHISKLKGIIPAAASGILSVENGLYSIMNQYNDDDIIVLQESTRPMVSIDMISKLLQSCYLSGSANICQSMRNYVQFFCKDGEADYIDRNKLVDLQSPEAYRFSIIKSLFVNAKQQNHELTESCCVMLMYNLGYKINFIESTINNIKIIHQEDAAMFAALLMKDRNI